ATFVRSPPRRARLPPPASTGGRKRATLPRSFPARTPHDRRAALLTRETRLSPPRLIRRAELGGRRAPPRLTGWARPGEWRRQPRRATRARPGGPATSPRRTTGRKIG